MDEYRLNSSRQEEIPDDFSPAVPSYHDAEPLPYGYAAPAAALPLPPSYEAAIRKTSARSNAANTTFMLGLMALFFLAFWMIYPPAGLIMTLLSLITSVIGLRLGRRARRETPSNLAEAGYMFNLVGLVASAAFCLMMLAVFVGLIGAVTALL